MKYQFRTTSRFTDSINSDRSGFTYFVERSFKNKFLFLLTFGWHEVAEFDSYEKAQQHLQYCNTSEDT